LSHSVQLTAIRTRSLFPTASVLLCCTDYSHFTCLFRNKFVKICLILYSVSVIIVPCRIIWSWYTGRWWARCYIWYSDKGTGWSRSPPSPLLVVPNTTAYPSTASVPITVLQYNGPLLCGFNVPFKGLTSHCGPNGRRDKPPLPISTHFRRQTDERTANRGTSPSHKAVALRWNFILLSYKMFVQLFS